MVLIARGGNRIVIDRKLSHDQTAIVGSTRQWETAQNFDSAKARLG
jgi:hypothetical protein